MNLMCDTDVVLNKSLPEQGYGEKLIILKNGSLRIMHSDNILRVISFCIYNCAIQKQYFGVLKLSIQIDQEYVKIIDFSWRTFLTNQQ